jgi:ATP-binding cassette subfamily C protein CydC
VNTTTPSAGRPSNRIALVSAAGLTLAVVAEACSIGLLGLSGWFIASSAVAGAATYSMFSLLNPSGGVRAFAVARIVTNYAGRVTLHSAALRRISAARLAFYDGAATGSAGGGAWSGQSLDRVMADADTSGMALIQATAPVTAAAVMTVGGCLVIGLAGYPLTAAVVAVAAAVCATGAVTTSRRTGDPARARALLRTELVTAVDAWPEMASLGAASRLAQRTGDRLAAYGDRQFRQAAVQARTTGAARAVTASALLITVVLAARGGAGSPMLVFLALLSVGVLGNAERLSAAAEAKALACQARRRLDSADHRQPGPPAPDPAFRADWGHKGLAVSGYRLPATPTRDPRPVQFNVAPGQTLFVTGASGTGKTTLLDAITTGLHQRTRDDAVVTAVLADDYLFTGTIATNIRLAAPGTTTDEIADLLAATLLDRSGLQPATPVGTGGRDLSGGEQRRLHIARALATRPEVLLIDEPTAGLDAATATYVLAAIRSRLPHAILVMATHQLPARPDILGPAWITVPLD